MVQRLLGKWRNLGAFLVAVALLSAASGIYEATFNNYMADGFSLTAAQRGALEFPRELPGFLTVLFVAGLAFMCETRIAALAALATGLGMWGLLFSSGSWGWMIAALLLWSVGTHLIMPVRSTIAMDLAQDPAKRGRLLGQISGVAIAAQVVGCGVVWWLLSSNPRAYGRVFASGGTLALLAGVFLLLMRMPGAHIKRPRLVWKRRYWLFYVLSFLFGARKQIFITFGPWVLVKIFNQKPVIFAQLMIAAALLGMLFQPLLGRAIDRFGERRVLMADAIVIAAVCLGYGFADRIGERVWALRTLYACYICDILFFSTGMARDIYVSKIAERREDVAPTLSLGVSINHVVSMSIPALGGWMWMRYGHGSVFTAAAAVAVVMFVFASRVRLPAPTPREQDCDTSIQRPTSTHPHPPTHPHTPNNPK